MHRLDQLDLTLKLSKHEEEKRVEEAQRRLLELRLLLGGLLGEQGRGPGVLLVFEGWDASGKGGAIKRLVANLDPRHVRVVQYGAPTADEKRHHFLARFFSELPGFGDLAIYDRSWYGRVLVERVEGFATEEQWQRGYDEIVQFERSLALEGTILVTVWMHISDEEQLRRFEHRQKDPLKSWKLTPEDWRNREKRAEYEAAIEEMLGRTDHPLAPWELIEAESKRFARVKVLETVVARIEEGMRHHGVLPAFDPQPAPSGAAEPPPMVDLEPQNGSGQGATETPPAG